MDYLALKKNHYISSRFDQSAWKFTFVRNPYDRFVSLYYHFRGNQRISADSSFLDFCRMIDVHPIEPIGLYDVNGFSQCNPQVAWLDGIDIDFIARFENLHHDVRHIAQKLSMPFDELGHHRKSSRKHYSEYYCSESIEIVRRIYHRDFAELGYDQNELVISGC